MTIHDPDRLSGVLADDQLPPRLAPLDTSPPLPTGWRIR